MYAAARISDLPELRDLRNLFTEKYGNSLEPYINKEVKPMIQTCRVYLKKYFLLLIFILSIFIIC